MESEGRKRIGALTSRQRAHLRALAHHLKPVLHIGQEGVTDGAVHAAHESFHTHELIKVKVLQAAPEGTREAAEALAARIDGTFIVQLIGRTVVLYRPHPDKPEIILPS